MINDDFDPPSSAPYDDSPSAYQAAQEKVRTDRRLVALEVQVRQLKAELERKNTKVEDVGRPVPYVLRPVRR